jgi:hypothetical protein
VAIQSNLKKIKQGTSKQGNVKAVNGNKIPDHRYKSAYVNETTPEEQKELERIKTIFRLNEKVEIAPYHFNTIVLK